MRRTYPAIATLALALVMAAAGCGGDSSGGGAYGSETESTATSGAATIAVKDLGGDVGSVLVDSKGFTLYYFEKDKGGKSACYGSCAGIWPPLTTEGAPEGTGGVQPAKLGTTKRSDGTVQVTYAGWPLYTYVADTKPGEDNGTDVKAFGATWYPLHPNGEKAGE